MKIAEPNFQNTLSSHLSDAFKASANHCFPNIDKIIEEFQQEEFLSLSLRKRFKKINQTLCELIQDAPLNTFLLTPTLDYIERVNKHHFLNEPLTLSSFEFWLNIFSEVSYEKNYEIRAKISGKHVPRSVYQLFFPIGMDKVYTGTHFVVGHLSPDVDTMVASFWGWLDAFASRIGTGLHLWSLPGGAPDSPISSVLRDLVGRGLFTYVPRTGQSLTLSAMDLVTQKQLKKEFGNQISTDLHSSAEESAIILVNEQGHFVGDWRVADIELVRPITISFKSCLRWFENNLHTKIISLFAKRNLATSDLPAFCSAVFSVKIKDCEPALDFNQKQKEDLGDFFEKILGLTKKLDSTFSDLIQALDNLSLNEMAQFQKELQSLAQSGIFDSSGRIIEDRPTIFHLLDKIINQLDSAIHRVRNFVERLDIVFAIKHKVLGLPLLYLTLRSDVDEMKQKMQNQEFLPVVIHEKDGSLFPVGIVRAADLRKQGLGTVSLRDFCNFQEVKMASYLEVISVLDHHKSALATLSVPAIVVADVQSCNVLLAEQAFKLNDQYSLGGQTVEQVDAQLKEMQDIVSTGKATQGQMRIYKKLLQRKIVTQQSSSYYIHKDREFQEYLTFLLAILDDTDLLTKVTARDVECVAELMNRLKSLSLGREVEIVSFDDLSHGKDYAKRAALLLLRQVDLYSLYKKIFDYREAAVKEMLLASAKELPSAMFVDTKEQNGCSRIGQTKLFYTNFPLYLENADIIRKEWLKLCSNWHQEHPEIDLYIHMMTTIASAEEVYANKIGPYRHKDEFWFWIPPTLQAQEHLSSFLIGFQYLIKELKDLQMEVEIIGSNTDLLDLVFKHNFSEVPRFSTFNSTYVQPMAIFRFTAGTLNSRKAMISPYIPQLVP